MSKDLTRIVTYETTTGTYYVPQYWYSGGMFSKPRWKDLMYCKSNGSRYRRDAYRREYEDNNFEDVEFAKTYCKRYNRIHSSGKVIVTYTED